MDTLKEQNINIGNSYTALFGVLRRTQKPNGTWVFTVVWSRLMAVLAAAIVFFWMAMSLVVYMAMKYWRGYDEMTFSQAVIYPFDQSNVRVAFGNYNIEKAEQCLKEGKLREAYMNLAFGVGRAPKNVKGCLLLSQFYLMFFNRPDLAIDAMEKTLIYAKEDAEFMRLYMRTLIEQTEDKRLIDVAEKLLADGDIKNPAVTSYLAMSLSTIYALHGNFERSKEYLVKYKLDKTLPGILRLSKNEWEQGKKDEAVKIIADNFDFAESKEPLYALLVSYYTSMNDFAKARQYSMLRSIENPFSVEQRLEYISLQGKSGDAEAAKAAVDSFYDQYSADFNAMVMFGNYAADIGDIALMRRIYENALTKNFQIAPFCLLLLETMVTNGNYQGAVDFSQDILKSKPVWTKRYEDVLSCLRAVAYYGSGNVNMADLLLNDVLNRNLATPRVLVATARRLDQLGGTMYAQKLLESAVDRFPRHQLALTRLVQIDIKLGNSTNLDKHIVRLIGMRRPPRELVIDARKNLGSDKFIFANNRAKIMNEIDSLINNTSRDVLSDSTDEKDRILSTDRIDM